MVLDGVGIGAAEDAAAYGDAGSDTLGNVARAVGGLRLPVLESLGLGRIAAIEGVRPVESPRGAFGQARPAGPGKDSTAGHWELCGLTLERPFRTYPDGFPREVIDEFARRTGRGCIGNRAASGTAIIRELGARHLQTGEWIVYTSADSVFQVAAHEEKVPLEELYAACAAARRMLAGEHSVSRVIARPFLGGPDEGFARTPRRRDYSVEPSGATLLDRLEEAGVARLGIGKVDDLFAARGITSSHAPTNAEAYRLLGNALSDVDFGLVFANVLEFDQTWGHRNDVPGFHRGLVELDAALGGMLPMVREEDLLILTADHGNDPTTPSTDHSRENVPVVVFGPRARPTDLGVRASFADVGQTVAEYFGVAPLASGASFLGELGL